MHNALLAVFLLLTASLSAQSVYYAAPDGQPGSSGSGSYADPYNRIEDAVVAAAAQPQGGEVRVKNGSYVLTEPVVITTAATATAPVTIKPETDAGVTFAFAIRSAFDFTPQSSWITLEGFEIDGGTATANFWRVVAEDFWSIDGNPGGGGLAIILDGEHLTVRNNYIHDCYQKAVEIRDGRYVEVVGNIINSIGHTSLSGGHGIMRQQKGREFFDNDDPDLYRWDIRENLVYNVAQRIYSWVPSKGRINMTIDEGKSILIDDPKDTDNRMERMKARIRNNVVAYGTIDHIRLKSTPNLEVSNNTIYSTAEEGKGVTDRGGDDPTAARFRSFIFKNNAAQTAPGINALEIDTAVIESTMAGGAAARVRRNYAAGGRVKPNDPAAWPGLTRLSTSQLFTNPESGDFSINAALNLPTTPGAQPAVLSALATRAASYGASVHPAEVTVDHLLLSQTILDNIPGVDDGQRNNETVFRNHGTISADRKKITFPVKNNSDWANARNSPGNQVFELNPVYRDWYRGVEANHSQADGSAYERLRWGDSHVRQNQKFNKDWLLVSQIAASGNTQIRGYNNNFQLDGDLLVDFEDFTPEIGDHFDLIVAGSISGVDPAALFDDVKFEGYTPPNYSLEVVTVSNRQRLRLTILAALPAELKYFTAQSPDGKTTILEWATARENDNAYFAIQRSTNARSWTTIGRIGGQKSVVNEVTHYTFTDQDPEPGTNYYRLRQTDLDGTSTPFDVAEVHFGSSTQLLAYPNPAHNLLRVTATPETLTASLSDVTGRTVLQTTVLTDGRGTLDVSGLAPGTYFLRAGDATLPVVVRR